MSSGRVGAASGPPNAYQVADSLSLLPQSVPPSPVSLLGGDPKPSPSGLDPAQKHRAEAMTSLFENSTQTLQYGYIENIHDGRGYTAGRAGFTTATGDLVEVVRDYTAKVPKNSMAGLLPRLDTLAHAVSDDVTGLERLPNAWTKAAKDPTFRQVQDDVVDRLYYQPAMDHAATLGIKSALGKTILYDAIIQHGDSPDYADGLPALIAETNKVTVGSPADGADEQAWLRTFLRLRRADLACAHDPATRTAWAESVGRVDVQQAILDAGNLDLKGPLHFRYDGDWTDIP